MDAKMIAAGLTKAQAEALLAMPDPLYENSVMGFELEKMRLMKPIFDPIARAFGHIHTRKGLAVREALLANRNPA